MKTTKEQLNEYEEMVQHFNSAIGTLGSQIEEAGFNAEVGLISWQCANRLKDLYKDINGELERLKQYQNIK